MAEPARSLRTELLVSFGFVTSSAVILVGLTTLLLTGGDLRETHPPARRAVARQHHDLHRSSACRCCTGWSSARSIASPPRPTPWPPGSRGRWSRGTVRSNSTAWRPVTAPWRKICWMSQSHVVHVEKLAGIGRLAAGVAHEVRNPLGALGTYVEVLQRRGHRSGRHRRHALRDRADRADRARTRGLCPARRRTPGGKRLGGRLDRPERGRCGG